MFYATVTFCFENENEAELDNIIDNFLLANDEINYTIDYFEEDIENETK